MSNEFMKKHFKYHKCLTCEHLGYWDWYLCNKRDFPWYYHNFKYLINRAKGYFSWTTMDEFSIKKLLLRMFEKEAFIPDKPIKKCKYYEESKREKFWLND